MTDNELISKKELLQMTGISYGQLYRWKRENLIPESWFIKKSAFTGQETFFPKEKILKRTQMILELKDKYSLEDLAKILTPEATNRTIGKNEILARNWIKPEVAELFAKTQKKDYFNFTEFILMNIANSIKEEYELNCEELENLAESSVKWLQHLKTMTFKMVLCRRDNKVFAILVQQDSKLLLDNGTEELKTFHMDEVAKELNLKFNEMLEGFE